MKRWAPYLLALTVVASAAHADSALDARYFDARGRAHYAAGDFAEALRAFLQAHRIAPSPATRFNVGLTAQLSGEPQLAWSSFEAYLASTPAPDDGRADGADAHDSRQRADAVARQRAVEAHIAVLTITSDPPGAQVYVDRREYGARGVTPVRVAVLPGAHRVTLEAARHATGTVDVVGEAGAHHPIALTLEPRLGAVSFVGVSPDTRLRLRRDDGLASEVGPDARQLPIGRYEARVVSEAVVAAPVFFHVVEGSEARATFVVRPAHVAVGRLVVRSSPSATISVDGVPRASTPEVLTDVPVGAHRVTISAPGYTPWERVVLVHPNQSTSLSVQLERAR
jgi:hypothetical protein